MWKISFAVTKGNGKAEKLNSLAPKKKRKRTGSIHEDSMKKKSPAVICFERKRGRELLAMSLTRRKNQEEGEKKWGVGRRLFPSPIRRGGKKGGTLEKTES